MREISSVTELPPGARICIYGAGAAGMTLLEQLRAKRPDVLVTCFLDSFRSAPHPSGLPQVHIAAYARDPDERNLIVIASIFSLEIETTLREYDLDNVCLYEPSFQEGRLRLHTSIFRAWRQITTPLLRLVSRLEEGETGKRVFVVGTRPLGDAPVAKELSWPETLVARNTVLGRQEFSTCTEAVFDRIRRQIEETAPESILFLATCGDFDQALAFLERFWARNRTPIQLVRPLLRRSWRGLHIPEVNRSFVYIPKCGSTSFLYSIREAFEKGFDAVPVSVSHQAATADSILKHAPFPGKNKGCSLFFTIGRNPYHRLASLYHSCHNNNSYDLLNVLRASRGDGTLSFANFCDFVCTCPDAIAEGHFRSQHAYVTDMTGTVFVDTFFKLEDLIRDSSPLESLLRRPVTMYHLGQSAGKKTDYMRTYYADAGLRRRVYERYRDDFALFGYDPAL